MVEDNASVGPVGAADSADFGSASGTWSSIPASALPRPSPRPAASQGGTAAPPSTTSALRPASQQLAAAIDSANAQLASVNRVVQLRVDSATGVPVATVMNSQTGEVLQQIPGPDMAQLLRMLESWSKGSGGGLVDLIA